MQAIFDLLKSLRLVLERHGPIALLPFVIGLAVGSVATYVWDNHRVDEATRAANLANSESSAARQQTSNARDDMRRLQAKLDDLQQQLEVSKKAVGSVRTQDQQVISELKTQISELQSDLDREKADEQRRRAAEAVSRVKQKPAQKDPIKEMVEAIDRYGVPQNGANSFLGGRYTISGRVDFTTQACTITLTDTTLDKTDADFAQSVTIAIGEAGFLDVGGRKVKLVYLRNNYASCVVDATLTP